MIDKIPEKAGDDLLKIFNNAIRALEKGYKEAEATALIAAIRKEWDQRLRILQDTGEKELPAEGMLKALGYSVGSHGERAPVRRLIIDMLMTGTLPPVFSPAYVAEWGAPLSRQRYDKLHTVIFVLRKKAPRAWEEAKEEWTDDLIYIENKWRPQVV